MISRREFAAVAVGGLTAAPALPSPVPHETVEVELLRLGVPTDDDRRHVIPVHTVTEALPGLEPVGAYAGWDSPDHIGTVLRYFVRDGWLRADLSVPADYAADYRAGKWYAAVSIYADFGPDGRTVSRFKGIDRVSLCVPSKNTLWMKHRTGGSA